MLEWKESYSVGIELIDNQHKHLFNLGNSALELIKSDSCIDKSQEIIQLIDDLIQYTKFHFSSEESYMLKINFPLYNSHKEEHNTFIKKINSIDVTNLSVNQHKQITDLVSFLLNWILTHILENDKLLTKAII